VVSIFVNPTQFGPLEDFDAYPRPIEKDIELLESMGVKYLFLPTPETVYPSPNQIRIDAGPLGDRMEGAARPGHFAGVALVVTKLLGMVQPHRLYLGQKDYQQTVVLRTLVSDLFLPTEVVVCPTSREADGLARSSRNVYLNPAERAVAPVLYRSLLLAEQIARETGDLESALKAARDLITAQPLACLEYLVAADSETLEPVDKISPDNTVVLLLTVRFGTTRLLDNHILHL
jgi:pantoate--beta-alanine ligase